MEISSELIARLKEKKKLLTAKDPNHKKIKTALVINGGAMKGVWAAGVVDALHKLGFDTIFDIVIAVSSGTFSAAYFLSGEGNIAPKVFYEDLADKKFINKSKLHPKKIIGTAYGNEVFKKHKPIKEEKVKNSRTTLYIGVTDPDTGKEVYLNMKRENVSLLTAIHASSAIPFLHNSMVTIHGKKYLDGMISCGIPIAPALEQNCTDILVIENNPVGESPFVPNFIFSLNLLLFKLEITPNAKKAIFTRKQRYYDALQIIRRSQSSGISIGFLAPDRVLIDPLSIDKVKLKSIAEEAKEITLKLFRDHGR